MKILPLLLAASTLCASLLTVEQTAATVAESITGMELMTTERQ